MDTKNAFCGFLPEGELPLMNNSYIDKARPPIDHNADLAIEFAEWIQKEGWNHRDGGYGEGWYNNIETICLTTTRKLLAEFIKSKTPKPKTDQERIAELEILVAELRDKISKLDNKE